MIRHTNIISILLALLGIFFCSAELIGETQRQSADYEDFLNVNKTYATDTTVLIKQVIVKRNETAGTKTTDSAYCLFHRNGQCVRIKTKRGIQYFFSSNEGCWLFTNKLKSPLKVSGTNKVEEFEVQDLLKTDFKNEYAIIEAEAGVVTLERKKAKPAYKYILFQKNTASAFELTFIDGKKNPARKLVYHRGNVDGYDCFRQIDVYDLLFKKDTSTSWITEWIKPAEVPAALFTYSQMKALTQKIEALLP